MKTLILGGVRSGKSRLAEALAARSTLPVIVIATATAGDDAEMAQRIESHRAQRAPHWIVVEEPVQLAAALRAHGLAGRCLIVDCLTLWLTNLLIASDDTLLARERDALLAVLAKIEADVIFVGNETGMGIMPVADLARRFGDESGVLHQRVAQHCDRVVLTVAGLPMVLKGESLKGDAG